MGTSTEGDISLKTIGNDSDSLTSESPPLHDEIDPVLFQRLLPLHHLIIHHLSLIDLHKTLILSRYIHDITTARIYRRVTARKSLLKGLELWSRGHQRKLALLAQVEELDILDMEMMLCLCSLSNPHFSPRQYLRVFSNVKIVRYSYSVVNGQYRESMNGVVVPRTFEYMRYSLRRQFPWTFEEVHLPRRETSIEDNSDEMYICFESPGTPQIILLILDSASPTGLPNLKIVKITSSHLHGKDGGYHSMLMNVGVTGGCFLLDNEEIKCHAALPFKPSQEVFIFSFSEAFINAFHSDLGGALAVNHAATVAVVISTVLAIVRRDTLTGYLRKDAQMCVVITCLINWLCVFLNLVYAVSVRASLLPLYVYDWHLGNAFWTSAVAAVSV
ncbi:hypothetical protein IAT38_002986 [Cryptococcus sp. DSM 104549]